MLDNTLVTLLKEFTEPITLQLYTPRVLSQQKPKQQQQQQQHIYPVNIDDVHVKTLKSSGVTIESNTIKINPKTLKEKLSTCSSKPQF